MKKNGDSDHQEDPKPCESMQITPQINTQARLNGAFVVRADKADSLKTGQFTQPEPPLTKQFWRQADEWESPIWGWVVVNYANSGIQLFLPDGAFYREVRLSGKNGAQTAAEWLPFQPTKEDDPRFQKPEMVQLKLLEQRLEDPTCLRAFWDMIHRATSTPIAVPGASADFTNALIGRPLALTNVGWSLELANDAMTTQVDSDRPHNVGFHPAGSQDQYQFDVKLGGGQPGVDGLVAYFGCRDELSLDQDNDLGLNLDSIWSDFALSNGDKTKSEETSKDSPIAHSTVVSLTAYHQSPETTAAVDAAEYVRRHHARLRVYGVLMDPFSPIHAHAGILPVQQLSLPSWTWQAALARMKTFFHAGPVMGTSQIPDFVADRKPSPSVPATLSDFKMNEATDVLPAMPSSDWAWLQPYQASEDSNARESEKDQGDGSVGGQFMALPLSVDEQAGSGQGPQTALEGYLMMAGHSDTKR